jgi:bacterial/archaeal transporter family-2 protein
MWGKFGADVAIACAKGKRICRDGKEQREMLELLISVLFAVVAGVSGVTQQVLNANLKTALDSAAWSGFISYLVGLICMALLVAVVREPIPSLSVAGRVPFWAWYGGVFGSIFIICGIVLIPRLGAGTFIAIAIAAQLLTSLAFDHFGVLGLEQRSADATRLLGAALLIAGVVLIRR